MDKVTATLTPKEDASADGCWRKQVNPIDIGLRSPTLPTIPFVSHRAEFGAGTTDLSESPLPFNKEQTTMSRANKALVLLVVAALGLWGCAQGPANSAEKIKALEGKVVNLEEDYKAAASARDAIKK